jgi:hypothetical protein
MVDFAKFGPQNLIAVVLEGTGAGTWCHNEGCAKVKQLRVERKVVRLKT